MFEIKGKYATALIATENIEETALVQIVNFVNNPASEGSKIAIMADVHAGKGGVVGLTMTIKDRVVPNLCGVDLGCGVLAVEILSNTELDFAALDETIRNKVPHGFSVHAKENKRAEVILKNLIMNVQKENYSHILRSLGTLGGGNHFISVESDEGRNFLCIHSGSRNLGARMAKHYQQLAVDSFEQVDTKGIVEQLKAEGREKEISEVLKNLKSQKIPFDKDLAYLTGDNMNKYLHDIKIAQVFAHENRMEMVNIIFSAMGWNKGLQISSVHNYIDTEKMILRKGSVEAPADGGLFLIPLNMKDGTLVCSGVYNPEWNQSAPHGAGRAMSRRYAKDNLSFEYFKEEMANIWSSSVTLSTLDEAPGAYKPAAEIKEIVTEKYPLRFHLKTKYNFKSSEDTD